MSKVKFSLASGNVVEKPVVTCFRGSNATYLVLDNEAYGQMGYPIIGISRLNNNVAEKITDQGEWASVKENLKTIIGGSALPYENVPELISAQDDFFTQLTLPQASFDVLKNAYVPASSPEPAMEPITSAASQEPMAAPEMPAAPTPADPVNAVPEMPVTPFSNPTVIGPSTIVDPMMSSPAVSPLPVNPDVQVASPTPLPVTMPSEPVMPTPLATPAAPSAPGSDDLQAIKESFMQSCENMFDALIKKFENK